MPSLRADLAVSGGGLSGLALALAAAQGGAEVALIEERPLHATTAPTFDGRVTAIALGSKRLLAAIGAWKGMAPSAEPIVNIEVGEAGGWSGLRYDSAALAAETGGEPFGWIVENRVIREALLAKVLAHPRVRILAPAAVRSVDQARGFVTVELSGGSSGESAVSARLLAVCEGRLSKTRDLLGVKARHKPYGQTGLVCTLNHERPHGGLAVERFFPDGPFAMLPMTDGPDGSHRSSIVWALDDRLAKDVAGLDDLEFLGEVAERFGDSLGELSLEGPRWAYPLRLVQADSYTAPRAALVGDTARGIHPIAGQGWNLALRDVAVLAELIADRLAFGLDPGDAATLQRYASWRRFDGTAMVTVTDGINALFANTIPPLRLARDLGLGLVERLPLVKRLFMREAMGITGDMPRLMRDPRIGAVQTLKNHERTRDGGLSGSEGGAAA